MPAGERCRDRCSFHVSCDSYIDTFLELPCSRPFGNLLYFELGAPIATDVIVQFVLHLGFLELSKALHSKLRWTSAPAPSRSSCLFLLPKTASWQLCSRVSVHPCSSPISYILALLPEQSHGTLLCALLGRPFGVVSLCRVVVARVSARVLYFPPRLASRKSTFFLTDGRDVSCHGH